MLQKLKEISKVQNKIWNKVIATMLVITLTFANFILLGVVAGKGAISYAADNFEAQTNSTQHANVKFDAYFVKDGSKSHTLMLDASETSKLYFALNVRNNGYLKNASIELNSNNYSIAAQLQASEIMEKIEGNKIILKQINYGTEAIVDLPILLEINNEFGKNNVNKQSSLILRGTYVTKDGKEIEIEKEIKIHLGWTGSTNVKLVSNISKYIVNDELKELFLQEKVELSKEEKSLPLQKTILEIDVPKYNNILPKSVNVIANELSLTTGKQHESVEFNNTNWKYNEQTGKITIEVENKEVNGNIWAGLGKDEYSINYIYGEEAYNAKQEQNQIKRNISAKVFNYSGNEIKENTIKSEETKILTEKIGNVVTGKIEIEQNISKGNMYANCNSNNREYETKYNVKQIVEIPYLNNIEDIKVQEMPEQFLDENGNTNSTKIGGLNYTYYAKTAINVDNFNKILGKDGYITIVNSAGIEIGKIDVNAKQEEGNYVLLYTEKQDSIVVQTSTPIEEGNLIINHQKAIKADLPYTRNQIVEFKQIQANISVINNQEEAILSSISNLKETSTKVDMTINKQTITSESENVEIKLELNNTNEQSDLFVNPKFIIELPKNITTAKIEKAEVLFDDELKVKSYTVSTNENGNKQIELKLSGTQTKYNTIPNTNGTTINIQAKLGATKTELGTATLTTENANSIQYSDEAITKVTLNSYIATYLDITVDNLGASVITTEENEVQITQNETSQTDDIIDEKEENVQYLKMTVDSDVTEEDVLRKDDKYIFVIQLENQTPEDLDGVIEWSEDDINRVREILQQIEDLEKVENPTSEQTAKIKNLNDEIEVISKKYLGGEQKELQDLLDLKLEVVTKIEEQITEFNVLKELEQNQILTEEQEKRLNELQPIVGKIVSLRQELEVLVETPNLTEEQAKRVNEATEELIKEFENKTSLTEEQEKRFEELEKKAQEGTLTSFNDVEIKNVKLQVNLPKYIKFNSLKMLDNLKGIIAENQYNYNYDEKNNALIIEFDKYPEGKMLYASLETKIEDFGEDYLKEVENVIKLEYEQLNKKEKVEGQARVKLGNIAVELVKTTEGLKDENRVGDEIKFKLKVNNVGAVNCNDVIVNFKLPEGLYLKEIRYGLNEENKVILGHQVAESEKGFLIPIANINAGDSMYAYVTAIVENTEENKVLEVISSVKYRSTVEDEFQEQKTLWNVKVVENPKETPEKPNEEPEKPTPTNRYSISGIAWIDQKPDGIKSESENVLSQIKVMLVDVTNNKKIASVSTNNKGEYEFSNINLGEYQVIFEYDQNKYTLTEYKKTSEEEVNSDAIKVEDGIAITDVIKVNDKNIKNINIGLIKIPKFDLKLQKRVSKITVQNQKETKTYNFNEVELAKAEIDSKYINGTVVMIEYIIKVTNEGDVAGTVEKIVDYTPSNMVFSSDLNPSWVQDNSGNLYNTELSKITIEPGETKQINLVLRKNMTEDNTGTINNRAELVDVSNEDNLEDLDSKPNNKVQNEDDISMANVIIGIKTGSAIFYAIIILSSLIILAIGVYLIRKVQ